MRYPQSFHDIGKCHPSHYNNTIDTRAVETCQSGCYQGPSVQRGKQSGEMLVLVLPAQVLFFSEVHSEMHDASSGL